MLRLILLTTTTTTIYLLLHYSNWKNLTLRDFFKFFSIFSFALAKLYKSVCVMCDVCLMSVLANYATPRGAESPRKLCSSQTTKTWKIWQTVVSSTFHLKKTMSGKIWEIEFFSTFFSTWVQMSYWWKNMDVYMDGWMVPSQIMPFQSRL